MSSTESHPHPLGKAIRKTLLMRAGREPDAQTMAKVIVRTWRQAAALITPVIGGRGVEALFKRSLHLTCSAFPWLGGAGDDGDSAASLASFAARLEAQEAATATEAGYVLLLTFTELLATLIGESLTKRLLGPVWAPPSSTSEQETES